jgi:hypothetical protein
MDYLAGLWVRLIRLLLLEFFAVQEAVFGP